MTQTPTKHRGRRALIALVALGLLAVWAVLVGTRLVAARRHLLAGRDSAELAKTMNTSTDIEQGRPVPVLRSASAEFAAGHRLLATPLLSGVQFLPVVGRQLRSAQKLAAAAGGAADAAATAVAAVHDSLGGDTRGGPQRLLKIRRFLDIATTADQRLRALQLGPKDGLIGSLAKGRNRLSDQLDKTESGLERGTAAGQAALALLSGQHRVLLLAVNNAEMRAGSGMILQMGLLQTDDGKVQLQAMLPVDSYPVAPGAVPLPARLSQWAWVHPTDDWRDLLSSPSFDVTAATASQMWEASGHPAVDGVMAIDPVLLAEIIGVTGPVVSDGITYPAPEVVPALLHEQYVRRAADLAQAQRRQELGDLAKVVFARLDSGGWAQTSMGQALARAAAGRHVLMWSRAPADQAAWVSAGVAGALTDRSVMVNILNRGRNKLDYFLSTISELTVTPAPAQTAVTVKVHMSDITPDSQPSEVLGRGAGAEANLYPGQQLAEGDYLGIVSVSVPAGATTVTMDDVASPPINSVDGPVHVVAAQFIVRRGHSQDVTVHFTLPGSTGVLKVEPSGRVPQMEWNAGDRSWSNDSAHFVSW